MASWALGQETQLGGAYAAMANEFMRNPPYLVDLKGIFIFKSVGTVCAK
jgi:hypothetical protein